MTGVDRQHVEQYAESGRNAFTRDVCRQLLATFDDLRDLSEIDDLAFQILAGEGAEKRRAEDALGDLLAKRVDAQLRDALRSVGGAS